MSEEMPLLSQAGRAQEQLDFWKKERDDLIREAFDAGVKYRELAEVTGLSMGTLSVIINRANGRATPTPTERKGAMSS